MKNLFRDSDDSEDGNDEDEQDVVVVNGGCNSDNRPRAQLGGDDECTESRRRDQMKESGMVMFGVQTLLGAVTMEILDEPDILRSYVKNDQDLLSMWYDFHPSDEIERWKQNLGRWVLRIAMDHNFHNTDILNKKLDYYGLPTRPVRFSTWIRSVLSSCKDNIFDHDCNMHVIDNECDIDPEYHCVRIRVTKKLEDHSCSRTILDRVKKKLEENKDRLICQVSAFVWSLEDQWEIARERLDDNFNPYEERLDDRFDPSTVFSIDWESFETRLETHPSEALFSHVVSRQFFRNCDFQGQFRHDRYHHVSILHAICFETSFRYPFTIPVSALKKLVEAHPNALTLRSEGPSKGNLPLHYVLEQISLGRSDWLVDHIKVLLEAFPEGASVESVVDVQRGGFSNLETYEYRQYPIEILCS